MSLLLNGTLYPVANGPTPYSGQVTIPVLNISVNEQFLPVPVLHNQSFELVFNAS